LIRIEMLAGLQGASSNQIMQILKDWNSVLQKLSPAKSLPEHANESEDGSAPRDNHPVAVRRRKTA